MTDELQVRLVSILNCIAYESGYEGRKAQWRRDVSPMYKKVRASLKSVGMINPLWAFELPDGKYRITKGCCRAVACYDLQKEGDVRFKKVRVLVAPNGMSRKIANRLWRKSGYVADIPMLDGGGKKIIVDGKVRMFPIGF
jgi:hypothetical protein